MDLTSYLSISPAELETLLKQWLMEGESRDRFLEQEGTALIRERGLRLLKLGTRTEMIKEATVLQFVLDHPTNQAWRTRQPETFGHWQAIAQLLHDAARQTGAASLDVVLRSHSKHGRRVLEVLRVRREPVLRSDLRKELDVTESQMSHLLADLEEASLVRKLTTPGSKAVMLELDWAGEQAIERFAPPALTNEQSGVIQALQSELAELWENFKELESATAERIQQQDARIAKYERATRRGSSIDSRRLKSRLSEARARVRERQRAKKKTTG